MIESKMIQFNKEPLRDPDSMYVSMGGHAHMSLSLFLMEDYVYIGSFSPFQNSGK